MAVDDAAPLRAVAAHGDLVELEVSEASDECLELDGRYEPEAPNNFAG